MTDDDPSPEGDSRPTSDSRPDSVDLDVSIPTAAWLSAEPEVEALVTRAVDATLTAAGPVGEVELSVLLTDDNQQAALNVAHRGKSGSTNVLSFPSVHVPPAGPWPLGDITLALETVRREAVEQDKPFADHTTHLVVHGVLHLLGFDHEADADARAMERQETAILAGLGIADPYDDERAA